MKKKTLSLALAVCLFFTLILATVPMSYATDINDSSVWVKQSNNSRCTLASAVVMMRRWAILDGRTNWDKITESAVASTAWVNGAGIKASFTYDKISVSRNASGWVNKSTADKKKDLISLLKDRPEGVMVWGSYGTNGTGRHAVLLTDYQESTDTFYCADPSSGTWSKGRIKLTGSILGTDQSKIIGNLRNYWRVTNRPSNKDITPSPSPSPSSSEFSVLESYECQYIVTIPANYRVDCFSSPTATTRSTYISERASPYAIYPTKRLEMSDGTTRYFFVSGDTPPKDLYFARTASMSVVHNRSCSTQYTYEYEHPHYKYYEYPCGDKEYTGETAFDYFCDICNPPLEEEEEDYYTWPVDDEPLFLDTASLWAVEFINDAYNYNILPTSLQNNYAQNCTRAEFCALAVALIEQTTGKEITERATFNDTDDINVRKIGGMEIVYGIGDDNFNPYGAISRQEAAIILERLARKGLDKQLPEGEAGFSDMNLAYSDSTRTAIARMRGTSPSIMSGKPGNLFDPLGDFTREESITTMVRLWGWVKG